jgi:hypothetical protein
MKQEQTATVPGTATPTPDEAARIERMYREIGLARTVAALGVSRPSVDRLRGGLAVRPATLTVVRLALGQIGGKQ